MDVLSAFLRSHNTRAASDCELMHWTGGAGHGTTLLSGGLVHARMSRCRGIQGTSSDDLALDSQWRAAGRF